MSDLKSYDEMNPEQQLAYKMGWDAALANAETMLWCVTHNEKVEDTSYTWCRTGLVDPGLPPDCPIVQVRLLVGPLEDEER